MSEKCGMCKTCKWWQLPPQGEWWGGEDYVSPSKPWAPEEKMPTEFEVRYCRHPKLGFCERPEDASSFAVADASTYMAELFTGERFGCVLHESL